MYNPDILHFSSHGTTQGNYETLSERFAKKIINMKKLKINQDYHRNLRLVGIGYCHSQKVVENLSKQVDYVIYCNNKADPSDVRNFFERFIVSACNVQFTKLSKRLNKKSRP